MDLIIILKMIMNSNSDSYNDSYDSYTKNVIAVGKTGVLGTILEFDSYTAMTAIHFQSGLLKKIIENKKCIVGSENYSCHSCIAVRLIFRHEIALFLTAIGLIVIAVRQYVIAVREVS